MKKREKSANNLLPEAKEKKEGGGKEETRRRSVSQAETPQREKEKEKEKERKAKNALSVSLPLDTTSLIPNPSPRDLIASSSFSVEVSPTLSPTLSLPPAHSSPSSSPVPVRKYHSSSSDDALFPPLTKVQFCFLFFLLSSFFPFLLTNLMMLYSLLRSPLFLLSYSLSFIPLLPLFFLCASSTNLMMLYSLLRSPFSLSFRALFFPYPFLSLPFTCANTAHLLLMMLYSLLWQRHTFLPLTFP